MRVRYFVWNFKGYLWNSTQNILPIHWKMWISFTYENLRALWFKSSLVFLKRPPGRLDQWIIWTNDDPVHRHTYVSLVLINVWKMLLFFNKTCWEHVAQKLRWQFDYLVFQYLLLRDSFAFRPNDTYKRRRSRAINRITSFIKISAVPNVVCEWRPF